MAGHTDEATYSSQVSAVWKTTGLMAAVTAVEVAIALIHFYFFHDTPKSYIVGFMIVATLIKAYYIVAEFMHLKHEKKAFILALGVPLIFLVWALIALMVEGNYWHTLNHVLK